ncbi:MAG: hypothetical protein Alis3KO_00970 [Aliiglaciecola sp.]
MSYCTLDDMINRFGADELTQLSATPGSDVMDIPVVQAAIDDASNDIDSFVGSRYPLPLSVVPKSLVKLCANMARYNLYDNAAPELVEKNNKAAFDFLKMVAKGDVRLGLDSQGETPVSDEAIEMQSAGSVFSRANAQDFI